MTGRNAVAMARRRWTLVLYFFAEAAIILLAMRFGRGESIQPAELSTSSALLASWWVAPAALVALQKHRAWLVTTAAAMLGASAACLFSMYTSESSTAALGFLTVPVLRIAGALGALLAIRLIGAARPGRR